MILSFFKFMFWCVAYPIMAFVALIIGTISLWSCALLIEHVTGNDVAYPFNENKKKECKWI